MEHLEFINQLNELGCSFRSTNIENKVKTIEIPNLFGESNFVEIKNFQCNYTKNNNVFLRPTPLQAVITEAIDIDEWKHSWHNNIEPENFDKFRNIIQEKILNRSKEIDFLLTIYFQLNYEMSNQNAEL